MNVKVLLLNIWTTNHWSSNNRTSNIWSCHTTHTKFPKLGHNMLALFCHLLLLIYPLGLWNWIKIEITFRKCSFWIFATHLIDLQLILYISIWHLFLLIITFTQFIISIMLLFINTGIIFSTKQTLPLQLRLLTFIIARRI